MGKKRRAYAVIKRALDIFFSLSLLVFLWLPMLVIWIAVRLDSSGRGIFRQRRVGRGGRVFICYKFRTMYTHAPTERSSAEFVDAERYITPVGAFLRRTSLDELPQLFNVLRGDMSLVGPRPLILSEVTVHDLRTQNGVYSLRPGITGLSQIRGRDNITDERKIELDTEYLRSFGFIQDMRIMGATIGKVLSGEGIATGRSRGR